MECKIESVLKSLPLNLKTNRYCMSFLTNSRAIHGQDLRHRTLVLQVGDARGIWRTVGSPSQKLVQLNCAIN